MQIEKTIDEFLTFLVEECHYRGPKVLPDGRVACIYPLVFTDAIIVMTAGDVTGYEDRWCYEKNGSADRALAAWDGAGEPKGWHRHPASGRRRVHGDPATEVIAP